MKISTIIGMTTALTVALLGAGSGCALHQLQTYKTLNDQHAACVAAVGAGQAGVLALGKTCDPKIADAQIAALRGGACDQALAAKPEDTFTLRQVCSAPVKTLVAQRDAALGDLADARAETKTVRDGQAAAITRAEARARTETQRKADAAAALARAPRDADGLVVCDAVCLRQRAGVP